MSLSITSGTSHLIIPKRIVLTTIMIGLGAMLGMYLSEHMRAARTATILKTKNQAIKDKNELLVSEKEGYSDMLKELEGHMTEWAEEGGVPDEFLDKHKGFHDIAEALMKQVQSVHDLLIEKEYELIDKEALLEYQEQQLMDSEELEDRMVGYINTMATKLVALKQPLPAGLEAEPFFYVDMAPAAEGAPAAAARPQSEEAKKLAEDLAAVQARAAKEEQPDTRRALRSAAPAGLLRGSLGPAAAAAAAALNGGGRLGSLLWGRR
mmetsp:Transcript_34817/g.57356  ORF Transcript_34817/g.57356 Transcript_34817/m.57356 type:complete len:265 (+) Transcript_34817:131-925(+)